MSLELEIWREACRHLDIQESLSRMLPVLARHLPVDTIAIPSVLAVFNWPRDSDRYRRVALFVEAFFSKFEEFRKPPRHAKWKEANLNATLRGWKRFPAAEEWLARHGATQVGNAPSIDPAVVRAQAAKAAPDNPAEQEYLRVAELDDPSNYGTGAQWRLMLDYDF